MTTVNHKLFGTGTVVSNDAKTVTVNFNGEVKNLAIKFANLTNEDGTIWTAPKVKKAVVVKSDLSAYSDSELKDIYNKEKSEFVSGICDANKDAKSEGKKGFGFIN